jgi:RND family efflux transporter MFP subunit
MRTHKVFVIVLGLCCTAAAVAQTTPSTRSVSTGVVEPARSVTLAAEVTGRINTINAEEGQRVNAGDELVRLDAAELEAELASATGSLALAETELAYRRKVSERMQRLGKSKSVPQDRIDDAAFDYAAARDRLAIAKAALAQVGARLAETRLIAPFDGVITARDAEVGQLTQPGTPLLVLEDHSRLEFRTLVKEQDIPHIGNGDAVTVTIDALGVGLQGKVSQIIPSGDRKTHAFEVQVTLPAHEKLFPGMFGKAEFNY